MPRMRSPRQGSMQFWPRSRASDIVARVRTWPEVKDAKLLGFAGYKVGMTHIFIKDNVATSMTKGEEISVPVTVLECPPIKVAGVMVYRKDAYGSHCVGQILSDKLDKEVSRRLPPVKKAQKPFEAKNISDVRVLVYTQPKSTGIGKKTPEVFELGVGGSKPEDRFAFAQGLLGKEVKISDVFSGGMFVDSLSVTKGKGLQGPVKRFHIALRSHKSEKTKRGPGSLGPWHGFRGWRTPHQGQMGFQQRLEHNKQIVLIGDDVSKINPAGGFMRYGVVKNQYLLVKGSLGGAVKRLVKLTVPRRAVPKVKEAPQVTYVSLASKQ